MPDILELLNAPITSSPMKKLIKQINTPILSLSPSDIKFIKNRTCITRTFQRINDLFPIRVAIHFSTTNSSTIRLYKFVTKVATRSGAGQGNAVRNPNKEEKNNPIGRRVQALFKSLLCIIAMNESKILVIDVKDDAIGNPNKEEKNNTIGRRVKALFRSLSSVEK
ncbi:unnamed protein product [Mytilus edulis]|uniref:Uncharacterized protein n=1 Tax=Mytilus edulis TaxID=6550 RepID=A0A8S3VIZ1_MYTED|nr:unnamed protein product [Mytilus edulis]